MAPLGGVFLGKTRIGLSPGVAVYLNGTRAYAMLRSGLNLLLAAGMLVASIPHALCPCDHRSPDHGSARQEAACQFAAMTPESAPVCPHCRHCRGPAPPQSVPLRGPLGPCTCGACEVIPSVPPSSAVAVPPPEGCHYAMALEAVPGMPAISAGPEEGWATGPPDLRSSAGRAIPIFLGHLLL